MGVHGLWDILSPTARPVRVEALRNKRLAVDASIWIYQFLKAVRDSEGNQLKNSHIVGFFRRICKLLFFGIKPVFVFDGGVPVLKRDTIRKRREKREGNKESIEQTAHKILAKQLQKYAEGKLSSTNLNNSNKSNVSETSKATRRDIETDGLYFDAYYDDQMAEETNPELKSKGLDSVKEKESKMFHKQDDYDLPNIKGGLKVDKADNRIMTDYEYDRLTKDINDDLENVDLDKIDPQSKEFAKMPLSVQYIVLSHLRLRSRLRMGYTKSQLQNLFSDPMEFSRFQIRMVQKRNYFTQRVMNVTGMDGGDDNDIISRRIASDKNRAYNLQRTGDGYALSITKEHADGENSTRPIFLSDDIDLSSKEKEEIIELGDDESENDIDWDDVEVIKSNDKVTPDDKMESAIVENPLFIKDSDASSSEDESIEMEEVPLDGSTILAVEVAKKNENEDDDIMAQIKYLYEYSDKHNKKIEEKNDRLTENIIYSDDDLDDYHELQIKQFEDEELKHAIEKSKQDYVQMLDEEKSGAKMKTSLENEPPIILSTSTLAKTLKLPSFSMKNNLLFGGGSKSQINENKVPEKEPLKKVKDTNVVEEKKKALPLPDWFSNPTTFDSKTLNSRKLNNSNEIKQKKTMTEDEKAGLVSYGEINDYFSTDDENDIEFLEAKDTNNNVVEISDKEESTISETAVENEKFPIVVQTVQEHIPTGQVKLASSENAGLMTSKPVGIKELLSGDQNKQAEDQIDDDFEFSDEEEVNLLLGMEQENLAYDQFFNDIKGTTDTNNDVNKWTFSDESKLQEKLRKQKRDSDEVSTNMIYDVQDLLSRFGIPFITAPMEAEAQCAELQILGLVDGIITDDSDCFLFGGDRIYKNLFNEKNFVECYQDEDIIEELGLNRKNFIELAILLGSDYTDGLKGVGKVMAMEILGEFKTLENFKQWWVDYQNGKIDETVDTPIRKKLRKSLSKKLFLSNDFPNGLIYEAYLHPEVDHDKTAFKWGYPDIDKLRTFLKFYVGWDKNKVDEILLPVVKSLNKPQATIEEFFPVEMIQRRRKLEMSKRIKDATGKLKNEKERSNKRQKL